MRAKTRCSAEPLDGAEKTCLRPAPAAHVYLSSLLLRLRQNSVSGAFLLASLIAPRAGSSPQHVFTQQSPTPRSPHYAAFFGLTLIAPLARFVSAVYFRPSADHAMFKSTARRTDD